MTRRLDDFPPGHPAWQLLTGTTPFQACAADQRFSFSMHIPRGYAEISGDLPLIVAVHGTGRHADRMRDSYAALAEEVGAAVLAPLFPASIGDPDDVFNYKAIAYRGIRYDVVLLAMVDEAAARWRLDTDRFLLAGFSGGGQFAHRFAYLHPHRLRAVSIGAPGRVTLPSDEPWPNGLGGISDVFGVEADLESLRDVPVQVAVGGSDFAAELLEAVAEDPAEALAGATRVERALRLARDLDARGIRVRTDVVDGVGHDAEAVAPVVVDFFRGVLAAASVPLAEGAQQ